MKGKDRQMVEQYEQATLECPSSHPIDVLLTLLYGLSIDVITVSLHGPQILIEFMVRLYYCSWLVRLALCRHKLFCQMYPTLSLIHILL